MTPLLLATTAGVKFADAATGHISDRVVDAVLEHAVVWAKRLVRRGARRQEIVLYGPNNKPLKRVRVTRDKVEDD